MLSDRCPHTGNQLSSASGSCPAAASATSFADRLLAALARYSNVHRGTGHNSIVTTALYERAREIVREHLGLGREHTVVFLTPWRAANFLKQLNQLQTPVLSSADLGLPLGIRAVAARIGSLPGGVPFQPGGGTIRVVSPNKVVWAGIPDRFEAGTPNIIGAIALASALRLGSLGPATDYPSVENTQSGNRLLAAIKQQLIGGDALVPTAHGDRPYVNLDNGASTPTFQPVWHAFCHALRMPAGVQASLVERTRKACHRFFGAPVSDYDLFFVSNTTEAITVVAHSLRQQARTDPNIVVLNTMIEHNSNELPWRFTPGVELIRMPVDFDGFILIDDLETTLRAYNQEGRFGQKRIRLVCVCGASNVMGTYNDLPAISRIVHRYGAKLLVDAAQLAAHRPVRMSEDGIDFLAFSAHKMYAPFGSGGLLVRRGLLALDESEQAAIRASGDENVAGIAALGEAVELLERIGMDAIIAEERNLTCRTLSGMATVPGLRVYGVAEECSERFARRGGVICFELAGLPHNLAAQLLAEQAGIGVRNGCFCVNMYVQQLLGVGRLKKAVMHIGLALAPGLTKELLVGLVRVSYGIGNTEEHVDRLVQALHEVAAARRGLSSRALAALHFGTPALPRTSTGRRIEQLVQDTLEAVYGSSK
ncbi:MAG: aminotransferase class V-fold PLP-dependent enzyme [candidate division WOR-3 bacterium]